MINTNVILYVGCPFTMGYLYKGFYFKLYFCKKYSGFYTVISLKNSKKVRYIIFFNKKSCDFYLKISIKIDLFSDYDHDLECLIC